MASPFSVFRRNQKVLLVVLTLMAMFAFVFIPILMQTMGGSRPVDQVMVKTSKYGDLRQSDLHNLMQQRRRLLGVITDLLQAVGNYPSLAQQYAINIIGPSTEQPRYRRLAARAACPADGHCRK